MLPAIWEVQQNNTINRRQNKKSETWSGWQVPEKVCCCLFPSGKNGLLCCTSRKPKLPSLIRGPDSESRDASSASRRWITWPATTPMTSQRPQKNPAIFKKYFEDAFLSGWQLTTDWTEQEESLEWNLQRVQNKLVISLQVVVVFRTSLSLFRELNHTKRNRLKYSSLN